MGIVVYIPDDGCNAGFRSSSRSKFGVTRRVVFRIGVFGLCFLNLCHIIENDIATYSGFDVEQNSNIVGLRCRAIKFRPLLP